MTKPVLIGTSESDKYDRKIEQKWNQLVKDGELEPFPRCRQTIYCIETNDIPEKGYELSKDEKERRYFGYKLIEPNDFQDHLNELKRIRINELNIFPETIEVYLKDEINYYLENFIYKTPKELLFRERLKLFSDFVFNEVKPSSNSLVTKLAKKYARNPNAQYSEEEIFKILSVVEAANEIKKKSVFIEQIQSKFPEFSDIKNSKKHYKRIDKLLVFYKDHSCSLRK